MGYEVNITQHICECGQLYADERLVYMQVPELLLKHTVECVYTEYIDPVD